MTRILIALGLLIALAPFLGIPLSILRFLLPLVGLFVAVIGYLLRSPSQKPASTISSTEPLVA